MNPAGKAGLNPTGEARFLVPVRASAWLSGELGKQITADLERGVKDLPGAAVTRLARGFLVDTSESPGVALECIHRAVQDVEACIRDRYPVFHHEMGPVWTGTVQVVFTEESS